MKASYSFQFNSKWNLNTTIAYRSRSSLENHVENGYFYKDRIFEPNGESFNRSNQVFSSTIIRFQPFATWRRFNGARRLSNESGPTFSGIFEKAMGDQAFSKVSFQMAHSINLANWGKLNYRFAAAHFMRKPSLFVDFQHFKGNEINLSSREADFLALPYYQLSNAGGHVKAFVLWEPRKFLLTQNAFLSLYGLKENVGYAYLQTNVNSQVINYQEVSYRLTGIAKILGIDLVYPIGSVVDEKWKVLVSLPF